MCVPGKTVARLFVAAGMLFALPSFASGLEPAQSASALEWYKNEYVNGFLNGDPDFMNHYADHVYFALYEPQLFDRANLGTFIDKVYVQKWTENGWSQTEFLGADSRRLGKATVLITAKWAMQDDNGSPVTECPVIAWNYVVSQTESAWTIIAEFEAPCPE